MSKRNAIDDKPPAGVTQDDVDSLKQSALIADIFFISAGVFGTSAVILGFLTDWSENTDSKEKGPIQVTDVGFLPSPQGGFFNVTGTF